MASPPQEPHVERSVPPTTTAEEDLVTHGQRRVNLIWEVTQSIIAAGVTGTKTGGIGYNPTQGNR